MRKRLLTAVIFALVPLASIAEEHAASPGTSKPSPDSILEELRAGNARFRTGNSVDQHRDPARIALAEVSDQGDFAVATVLSCSDSRVPVEILFDSGIMDLFVVRVAGNVADTDEVGTIEYGVAHVRTPVLLVLGHTGCGAVKAVTQAAHGHGHPLERNIPALVDNIQPAVQRAMTNHPGAAMDAVAAAAVEENIWQSVRDIFLRSAAVRARVADQRVRVVGALYDLHTGEVRWLDPKVPMDILAKVEQDPQREMHIMAGEAVSHTAATADGDSGGAPKVRRKTPRHAR